MRIQIAGLSDGIHDYHFDTTAAELGLAGRFDGPVTVDAALDKRNSHIQLTARIGVVTHLECDRCVTPFSRSLAPTYTMFYVWNEPDATRFDPSEIQVIAPGHSVIGLDDDVRQTIQLSLPLKILCREDCKGLCPNCGSNLNEGPCGCGANQAG